MQIKSSFFDLLWGNCVSHGGETIYLGSVKMVSVSLLSLHSQSYSHVQSQPAAPWTSGWASGAILHMIGETVWGAGRHTLASNGQKKWRWRNKMNTYEKPNWSFTLAGNLKSRTLLSDHLHSSLYAAFLSLLCGHRDEKLRPTTAPCDHPFAPKYEHPLLTRNTKVILDCFRKPGRTCMANGVYGV